MVRNPNICIFVQYILIVFGSHSQKSIFVPRSAVPAGKEGGATVPPHQLAGWLCRRGLAVCSGHCHVPAWTSDIRTWPGCWCQHGPGSSIRRSVVMWWHTGQSWCSYIQVKGAAYAGQLWWHTGQSWCSYMQSILVSLHVAQLGDVSMIVLVVTYFMHTSFNYLYVMYLLSHSVLVTCDITPWCHVTLVY